MKKWLCCVMVLLQLQLYAQEYKITSSRTDTFSLALVKLLNCAADQFSDCKGDSLKASWLLGVDHKLSFAFPGSKAAIVRFREWDNNAYIEFRDFNGKTGREKRIKRLLLQIKNALGDQLYDPIEKRDEKTYFHGLSIRDSNGFFSMNMEIFWGSTSHESYLYGPEQDDESKPQKEFILLKIYGGVPSYQYYIKQTVSPNEKFTGIIQYLLRSAKNDFDSLRFQQPGRTGKRRDTLQVQGQMVVMNYRGTYSANISFAIDEKSFTQQWDHYQQVLQAALGNEYVYHRYALSGQPGVIYYKMKQGDTAPRIYLDKNIKQETITICVRSGIDHPTRRNLDTDDFD